MKNNKSVLIDIADTLLFLTEHESVSGIQRVIVEVWNSLSKHDANDVLPVAYRRTDQKFVVVDKGAFEEIVATMANRTSLGQVNTLARELSAALLDAEEITVTRGQTLFAVGSPWIHEAYFAHVLKYKLLGLRIVTLVYDLIPVLDPNFPEPSVIQFSQYLHQLAYVSDRVATISSHTRSDFSKYCSENNLPEPLGGVTRLPGGLAPKKSHYDISDEFVWPNPYVLVVGTIEDRKNHIHLLQVWQALLETLGSSDTPDLVCVGRVGWNVKPFLRSWVSDRQVKSKIHLLSDQVSDVQLRSLYANCLFTIYPSRYEGWGLPVSESLDFGKAVIAANNSSIPEAGENYAAYISGDDINETLNIVASWISNPALPQSLIEKAELHRDLDTWDDVTEKLLAELQVIDLDSEITVPRIQQGIEYGLASIREFPEDWSGANYLDRLFERRALPMSGEILTPENHAIARLAISGDIQQLLCDESGIHLESSKPYLNCNFKFDIALSGPAKLLISTAPGGGLLRIHAVTNSIADNFEIQSGSVIEIPLMESGTQEIKLEIRPTASKHVKLRSFLVCPNDDTHQAQILKSILNAEESNFRLRELETLIAEAGKVKAIEASLSWRITNPIRQIHSLARKVIKSEIRR